jgi:hypothetical protein
MSRATVEELFSHWITAESILREYVNGIKGWKVTVIKNHASVSLDTPLSLETLPLDVRDKVASIIAETCAPYMPNFSDFVGQPIDLFTADRILSAIRNREADMVAQGQPAVKEALARAFGLDPPLDVEGEKR